MTTDLPSGPAEHARRTREAYDALAPVWSATTDAGPFNEFLERPALRSLVPGPLAGSRVLDAGCASGAHAEWLLGRGAEVVGIDVSPAMVAAARERCPDRGRFEVADLAEPLPLDAGAFDGVVCSLVLHYLRDWSVPLRSFATAVRPGGWAVISLDHPFRPSPSGGQPGYFDTELLSDTWRKGHVEVTQHIWRRPLAAAVNAFAAAGFEVDQVAEAQPSAEALERFPEELGPLDGVPSFIVYRLHLRA